VGAFSLADPADPFRPCLVVPVYEHHEPLARQMPALLALGLPVLLVDDGSSGSCRASLGALADLAPASVRLLVRAGNGGKGAAVKDGLRLAFDLGFTHAVQVDADGQHDPAAIPVLLELSRREPLAVVCANPMFGPDAPKARRRWRRLTNFWMAVNTVSMGIADGMCGLRIYPLAATLVHLSAAGDRMDFDPEILVRLVWAGASLRFVPCAVRYPVGGSSGFRIFEDNLRISWMHTRLFFGMLVRFPVLVSRAWR